DEAIPGKQRPQTRAPELPKNLVPEWQKRIQRIASAVAAGPHYVVPSRLVDDEVKEPRESEPKDRDEDEADRDYQTDGEHTLGFAAGAAGNLFVGSSNARTRGSLVHEVLYRCELDGPAGGARWAEQICRERGAPGLA